MPSNTTIASCDKALRLSTEALPIVSRNAVMPVVRRRHRTNVRLEISTITDGRSDCNDELVTARMNEKQFLLNKQPTSFENRTTGI